MKGIFIGFLAISFFVIMFLNGSGEIALISDILKPFLFLILFLIAGMSAFKESKGQKTEPLLGSFLIFIALSVFLYMQTTNFLVYKNNSTLSSLKSGSISYINIERNKFDKIRELEMILAPLKLRKWWAPMHNNADLSRSISLEIKVNKEKIRKYKIYYYEKDISVLGFKVLGREEYILVPTLPKTLKELGIELPKGK